MTGNATVVPWLWCAMKIESDFFIWISRGCDVGYEPRGADAVVAFSEVGVEICDCRSWRGSRGFGIPMRMRIFLKYINILNFVPGRQVCRFNVQSPVG